MFAVAAFVWLQAQTPLPVAPAPGLDLRGAWETRTYVLADGTRHPVHGQDVFTKREWSVVSLVVEDGDGFHAYLRARGVDLPVAPADAARVPIRTFRFKDPEGHSLEVFSWRR
jgi:hypothetical protein